MTLTPDGWAAVAGFLGVTVAVIAHLVRSGKQWGKAQQSLDNINDVALPRMEG